MKNKKLIFLWVFICVFNANANGGTVVLDFETHKKLNTTNKYLLQNQEKIDEHTLLLQTLKDSVFRSNSNTFSVINNESLRGDIANIKIPYVLNGNKINVIGRNLDTIYPIKNLKSTSKDLALSKQRQQIQSELKQSIVYATNIINNSKNRDSEIEQLITQSNSIKALKDAVDLQNKIAIENLIEQKKTNILLASILRNQAKEKYKGTINIQMIKDMSESEERSRYGFKRRY